MSGVRQNTKKANSDKFLTVVANLVEEAERDAKRIAEEAERDAIRIEAENELVRQYKRQCEEALNIKKICLEQFENLSLLKEFVNNLFENKNYSSVHVKTKLAFLLNKTNKLCENIEKIDMKYMKKELSIYLLIQYAIITSHKILYVLLDNVHASDMIINHLTSYQQYNFIENLIICHHEKNILLLECLSKIFTTFRLLIMATTSGIITSQQFDN
jgi:hypothetical protein